MEIFKTKDFKTIAYNGTKADIIDVKSLEAQKSDIEERISMDVIPDEKELLEWARANYPMVDHSQELLELDKINSLLDNLKEA